MLTASALRTAATRVPLDAQILLLHSSSGPFAAPPEPCPFRLVPLAEDRLDSIPDHTAKVIAAADCDAVSQIKLPKQLALEDGAADLLDWFKRTSLETGLGASAQRDPRSGAPAQFHVWRLDASAMCHKKRATSNKKRIRGLRRR